MKSIVEQRLSNALDKIAWATKKSWYHIIGFLIAYAAFVYLNGKFFSECGGWNDLNWLGQPTLTACPTVSLGFDLVISHRGWLIGNALIFAGFFYTEHRILAIWNHPTQNESSS